MSGDLQQLEQRVGAKYIEACADRLPADAFDPSGWLDRIDMSEWNMEPLPPGTPEFPREQWASYPTKRTVALLMADRLLDFADELTEDQWMQLHMVMQYGGRTRIA